MSIEQKRKHRFAAFCMGLVFFVLIAISAFFICNFRAQNVAQTTIQKQRDLEQAIMDKSIAAIQVWREELVNQARYVSSSEMFRLFMTDARNLSEKEIELLGLPETLHSENESLRMLAEQRSYIQDLLRDLCKRRNWADARIFSAAGKEMASQEFAPALGVLQTELVLNAINTGHSAFGPIRETLDGFVIDMADPLFEVSGSDQKCAGALFVSIPADNILAGFLARNRDMQDAAMTRIVDTQINTVFFLRNGRVAMEALGTSLPADFMQFAERNALLGSEKVYSIGQPPLMLKWLVVLETPSHLIKEKIDSQTVEIYGFGFAASAALALLAAVIWAFVTSNAYKARAAELEKLNSTIYRQKILLDSVNASLKIGLLLVDGRCYIQVANPSFKEICRAKDKDVLGLPLVEVLPQTSRIPMLTAIAATIESGKSDTIEVNVEADDKSLLYRVTLYPYASIASEHSSPEAGCVAIFQDITEYRKKALVERQRKDTLIKALEKAIESVDSNLAGHSDKVAALSEKIAQELGLEDWENDTLQIAARLSQISKLFIPKELLQKNDKLNEEEKMEVAKAADHANNILQNLDFDVLPVKRAMKEMGERLDGSGPCKMTGEDVSIHGRILAAINAFVAMTNPRPWRNGSCLSKEDALKILASDNKFDPEIVKILAKCLAADRDGGNR